MNWKVDMREKCKVCGGDFPNSRWRTFCSKKCRKDFYNKENAEKHKVWTADRKIKSRKEVNK